MTHVSASQLSTFRDCPRKWAYRYIDGIKTPPKPTLEFGLEGHKRNENWLKQGKHVGEDDVGKVCAQGIRPGYMPTPGPNLLVESKFDMPILDGALTMTGFVDCVLPPKPVGKTTTLPVVHDWKFTKDLRWAMTPEELAKDPQAAVYSYWAQQFYDAPKVVVRWVYFCGRINSKSEDGRPRTPRGIKKVELTFTKAQIEANWDRELETAKQILDVRNTYKKAAEVPGNELACDKYGGCDYRDQCPLGDEISLEGLFNQWGRTHNNNPEIETMSQDDIMAKLKAHTASLRQQKQIATEAAAAETASPEPEVAPGPVATDQTTPVDRTVTGGHATPEENLPSAEPTQQGTGIELVAQLQKQSGQVDTPEAPTETEDRQKDLLATLQAQTGVTTINPPEATKAPTPPEVEEALPAEFPATPTEAEAEPTKPTKPTKTTKTTKDKKVKVNTSKATKIPFVVCIDAVPARVANGVLGEVTHLADFVEPIAKAIAKGYRSTDCPQGVDHWNLIEFGKGSSILAHQVANLLDTKGYEGVLVVDSYTAEGRALTNVLTRRADAVFRGVR